MAAYTKLQVNQGEHGPGKEPVAGARQNGRDGDSPHMTKPSALNPFNTLVLIIKILKMLSYVEP